MILLTGMSGYIGSHTAVKLISMNYKILGIDNFSNSNKNSILKVNQLVDNELKIFEIDLLDKKKLDDFFNEHEIEAVIHFAGLKSVGDSVKRPLDYYSNNVTGTLNLLHTMTKYNVKKIVFSSSATVYGDPEIVPIVESSKLKTTNPYGTTKLVIEEILSDLAKSDADWSVSILRYFNPIGAHSSGLIGEHPFDKPNNLMPYISQVAVGRLPELKIYGADYPTKDGTGVRDYIHVDDLALGHVKALEQIFTKTGLNVYNLGTGKGYSVLEIVRAFEQASSITIPYKIVGRRAGDIAICYADPLKAKLELGWEAKKTLNDMCVDAWNWQKNNPYGFDSK